MAQDKAPPANNTIGEINNNSGIITQGQIGNNYLLSHIPPVIENVRQVGSTRNEDGTHLVELHFSLRSQVPANELLVAVASKDVVPSQGIVAPSIKIYPINGGVTFGSQGQHGDYDWVMLRTPPRGEYGVRIRVPRADSKPEIKIEVK